MSRVVTAQRAPSDRMCPRCARNVPGHMALRAHREAKLGRSEYMRAHRAHWRIEIPLSTLTRCAPGTPHTQRVGGPGTSGDGMAVERGHMAVRRQDRADLEKPWDELTDEQKDRAYGWAREVMELGHRAEQLNQELDRALRRQEVEQMEKASAELYRALGHPEGYQYRGGPVGWDGVGA